MKEVTLVKGFIAMLILYSLWHNVGLFTGIESASEGVWNSAELVLLSVNVS